MKNHPVARHLQLAVIIALLFSLWSVRSVRAQENRLRFERLTGQDGLAQNTVNAVLQDKIGYLWFATEEGLDKYDGLAFTHYAYDRADLDSLSSSRVQALYEDRQGRLWVGTDAGLDGFDRAAEIFTHVLPAEGETAISVQALAEDDQGRLWVGSAGHGIWVLDDENGVIDRFVHDPQDSGSLADDHVYAILPAPDGSLWLGTDAGLERYDPENGVFEHFPHERTNPNSPTSDRIRALFLDRDGELWIGTDGGGLNRLDPQRGIFSFYLQSTIDRDSLVDNRVLAILEDQTGELWVGTPLGLDRLDRESGRFTHYHHNPADTQSLSSSQVLCLYADRSGVVWIGTRGGGLSLFKHSAHKFNMYQASPLSPDGLSGNTIGPILEDRNGQLWVGTLEAGLNRWDRKTGTWTVYRHDPTDPHSLGSDFVSALLQDSSGRLWVGLNDKGLDRFDSIRGEFIHYRSEYGNPVSLGSNLVTSLAAGDAGGIWIGTLTAGLDRLDPDTGRFTHFRHDPADPNSLSADDVLALHRGPGGDLWVGTDTGGLNRWDPQSGAFQRYHHDPNDPDSLGSDRVYSLWEQPEGVLWVGTREGLDRLDVFTGRFRHYETRDGLPGSTVTGLLGDEQGRIWISTTHGLARLDPQIGKFQTYGVDDGLQSQEFIPNSAYRSPSGELFFGGVQGFNAFFPDQVRDQSIPPPVVVTAFKKHNQLTAKDLTGSEPIELTYRDSFVSFEFAALDYNAPLKNRFAYQLEGFDPDWIDAGTRSFVSYTNLPGGQYTFRLKAANSDGAWNETGIAIPVSVTPPLWETGWFRALCLLGLAGAVLGAYQWRVRSIGHRNLELEQKVAELSRQVEEAAVVSERNRLARDLHDSVNQSLYSLTLLTEAGLRLLDAGELTESREVQVRLGEIAQQVLQEMRLLVYELRPPELAQTGLVGALEHRLEAVERRAGVQARLVADRSLKLDPVMEEQLYLLAKEALNNALKHAGDYSLTLSLSADDGCLSMEVRDTGSGFDPTGVPQGGLGLVSMRERAQKLGGELEVVSAPGEGTCVRFRRFNLPVSLTGKEGTNE